LLQLDLRQLLRSISVPVRAIHKNHIKQGNKMTKRTTISPPELFPAERFSYAQAVVTEGSRQVHCAGQTSWDIDGKVIGEGDLAKQCEVAFGNLKIALEAAGASVSDIVRCRMYVVDYSPDQLEIVGKAMQDFFDPDNLPAATLLGVQSLALPGFLVEIDATAILD
jgi:enamine deaminase RidA (YjgF/YER057c/UK114 family)